MNIYLLKHYMIIWNNWFKIPEYEYTYKRILPEILIILHFYLVDNPNAVFTRVLNTLGISQKIQEIWELKVKSGLIKKSNKELKETSSLSGYILKPGKIRDPLSTVKPALLFLFGPIPLLDHGGIALNIATLESPLWWLLYLVVITLFIRKREDELLEDPNLLLTLIFFFSLVAFSSLVEVNLGTSFRHRSVLLVPLIFMYVRSKTKSAKHL